MSQTFSTIAGGDIAGTVLLGKINDDLLALVSDFSGAAAPSYTTPYQRWADTTNFVQQRRNAANAAWNIEHALNVRIDEHYPLIQLGALSASLNRLGACPHVAWYALELVVISDTATVTSTGGNNWTFQVRDLTAGQNLFATAKTTNGDELAANTAKVWTFDQYQSVAANAVLQLQITKYGTPSSPLADVAFAIRGYPRGA